MQLLLVFLSLFSFLIIFAILVIGHELGHYYVAKKSGTKILEFSVGMGPAIYQKIDSSGTIWSIRIFPIGGYVLPVSDSMIYTVNKDLEAFDSLSKEEKESKLKEYKKYGIDIHKDKFKLNESIDSKKIPTKLLFTMGGILINLLLVWVGIFLSYSTIGKKIPTNDPFILWTSSSGSTAILVSNITYEINHKTYEIKTLTGFDEISSIIFKPSFYSVVPTIYVNTTSYPIPLIFVNNGLNPEYTYKKAPLGPEIPNLFISETNFFNKAVYEQLNPLEAIWQSFVDTWILIGKSFTLMYYLINPWAEINTPNSRIIWAADQQNFGLTLLLMLNNFYIYLALFSALLLIFNILPIPPLDGYKFLYTAYEGISKKKISPEKSAKIDKIGWTIIMVLTVWMFLGPLLF